MEQNSLESDDNSADQMDDSNLLEPLSEVSFSEREKSFNPVTVKSTPNKSQTDKTSDSSLPDARAKVLHLQRVQRGGGSSSSDTGKSSNVKKRNSKSHSVEKDTEKEEETVSLSLDSLIRRGVMNDIKKAANFKSNFKFGKPDDDISLRVNPSANLFYEHPDEMYSDSESDSYESSGERDGADDQKFGVTSNGSITNGNGLGDHVAAKRKRGRPPLTEEEKSERAAQKEAIRLQNRSLLNSSSQVDDLSMAMGHSIFHASSPKKRGRPPKNRYPQFLNSTAQDDQDAHNDSSRLDDSATEFPVVVKKKRGRKPKSYYMELAAAQANESGASISVLNGTIDTTITSDEQTPQLQPEPTLGIEGTTEAKKRGRKPKYMENYLMKVRQQQIKLEQQHQQQLQQQQQQQHQHQSQPLGQPGQKILKKRGRKPKSFYLQQMVDRANESAPAVLHENDFGTESGQKTDLSETIATNTSIDLSIYANKRGRRPKAYYEQLAAFKQDNDPANSSIEPKIVQRVNVMSDEPPAKKKRGRKPKSYYWNLQLQQAADGHSTTLSQSDIQNANLSSHVRLSNEGGDGQAQSVVSFLPTTKRLPKPGVRPYVQRAYVRRIIPQQKIFRRPVKTTIVFFMLKCLIYFLWFFLYRDMMCRYLDLKKEVENRRIFRHIQMNNKANQVPVS